MTIGQMVRQYLTKLDWFSTLFPRIPVPIQKQIESKLDQFARENNVSFAETTNDRYSKTGGRNYERPGNLARDDYQAGEPSRSAKRAEYAGHCDRDREPPRTSRYEREDDYRRGRDREREYERERDYGRERDRVRVDRDRPNRDRDYDRDRDRHREKRSRSRDREYQRDRNYERDRKYR